MMAIYIGTVAPALAGGWWPSLITAGSAGRTYVQALQGDGDRWDRWPTIRRCNPLVAISATFRAKLIEERGAARCPVAGAVSELPIEPADGRSRVGPADGGRLETHRRARRAAA